MTGDRACYWIIEPVVSHSAVQANKDLYLVYGDPVPAAAFTEAVRVRNPHLRLDVALLHRFGGRWDALDLVMLGEPPWLMWTDRYADLLATIPWHAPGRPVPKAGCRMAWPEYFAWLDTLGEE